MRVEVGGTGKSRDHGNWSQDTLCEKKKLFPIKGKRNMEQKQGSIAGCFLLTFAFSSRAVQIPWAFGLL